MSGLTIYLIVKFLLISDLNFIGIKTFIIGILNVALFVIDFLFSVMINIHSYNENKGKDLKPKYENANIPTQIGNNTPNIISSSIHSYN